jgi:hypothetical protein
VGLLVDRFLPDPDNEAEQALKLPVLEWRATMNEYARGVAGTPAQIRASIISNPRWTLTDAGGRDEIVDLDVLLADIDAEPTNTDRLAKAREIGDVILLAEGGVAFGSKAAIRTRLGL